MRGAVPCLSTDLTTHAVPHFIQALQMGRRTAPKALNFRAMRDEFNSRSRCGGGRGCGGDVFLGACRRRRRRGGLQLYQPRATWGATGQLSGIWLGLWVSASGGAAQSASIFIKPRAQVVDKVCAAPCPACLRT